MPGGYENLDGEEQALSQPSKAKGLRGYGFYGPHRSGDLTLLTLDRLPLPQLIWYKVWGHPRLFEEQVA